VPAAAARPMRISCRAGTADTGAEAEEVELGWAGLVLTASGEDTDTTDAIGCENSLDSGSAPTSTSL
jgi:hypothetical protein